MTTKTIRAAALSTRHQLVRGGDGKPRTVDKLSEVAITGARVEARVAGSNELLTYTARDRVRVKT